MRRVSIISFTFVCVLVCIVMEERERKRSEVLIYFSDNGRRGREKIVKEADRNFMREGRSGEKDGNDRVWVLIRNDCPNFGQIKIGRPDGV